MADTKITALTALTAADPANDVIPIVDVSDTTMAASGTTKKISVNNILGASGTATLASATITGDLTVDTSTLKVDSANNRVGIGTASPTATLHVSSAGSVHTNQRTGGNGCFTQYVDPVSSNYVGTDSGNFRVANNSAQDLLNIQQLGVFSFGDGAGGTRMTLNATGLGVGVSPSYQIHARKDQAAFTTVAVDNQNAIAAGTGTQFLLIDGGVNAGWFRRNRDGSGNTDIGYKDTLRFRGQIAGTERTDLMIDSSGNVGIGVAPIAWNSSYRSIQLGSGGAISSHTSASLPWLLATANSFVNSVGDFKFIQNGYSTRYLARGDDGTQSWWTSNNGIAGGTVSYVQSMTLDASGNLLTGTTSALASGNTFQNLGTSRQVLSLKGDAFGSYTLGVWNASTTNDGLFQYFATETTLTVRGGISYNRGGGLVAYNTTSDYRAKDIIGPVSNSGSLIDSLKVYVGKMKGATIERPMLIAHEAQAVAPYAVTGTKDEVDADGNPKYQQMDVSALVPVLIAEIQSLRARVQTLETR